MLSEARVERGLEGGEAVGIQRLEAGGALTEEGGPAFLGAER